VKVLVTGGCGFIGSHLVDALLARGDEVRVLDDLSSGRPENLGASLARVELLQADLRDPATCSRACEGVARVFHQAAIPSVSRSVEQPEATFEVNVVGTHRLLLAARDAGVGRVVLASSSSVYGDVDVLPKREDQLPRPRSPYAAHKLSCEQLGRVFTLSLGLEVVALRYFNVFGPRQDPASDYAVVVPAFVARALAGKPATIHGDGGQTRDFTFVGDVAQANLLAAEAEGAAGQVFNVGTGERISILQLQERIAALTGAGRAPTFGPARAGDVRDSLADPGRAREVLGWRPEVGLDEGLKATIAAMQTGH
jgi:nucleoside-diphosphate-sugar epimerase